MKYLIIFSLLFSTTLLAQEANLPTYPNRFSCIDNTTGLEVVCDGMEDVEHEEFLRQQRALNYKPWDTEYLEDDQEFTLIISDYDYLFNPDPLTHFDFLSRKNKGFFDELLLYIEEFNDKTKDIPSFNYDSAIQNPPASIAFMAYIYTSKNFTIESFEDRSALEYVNTINNGDIKVYDVLTYHQMLTFYLNNNDILYIQPYLFGAHKHVTWRQ